MRRVGIYPGTFDPIHAGHIAFAAEAAKICKLDEVIFLPEHSPRYKTDVTDIIHRTALIEVAIRDAPQFSVHTPRSRQFTVQTTLPEIHALRSDAELTLLIGSDVAITLPTWQNVDKLLSELSLAIGIREGSDEKAITAALQNNSTASISFIRTPHAHLSSSAIRADRTTFGLPHSAMSDYIQEYSLYT